jgi:hypothetical protein
VHERHDKAFQAVLLRGADVQGEDNSNNKVTDTFSAYREQNDHIPTQNTPQICSAIASAKARRSPLAKMKRDRKNLQTVV